MLRRGFAAAIPIKHRASRANNAVLKAAESGVAPVRSMTLLQAPRPHLENEAVLAGEHGAHQHAVEHLVILLRLRVAHVRQPPLQVCAQVIDKVKC